MVVALSLAIMVIAFAPAAFAAPPVDKQSNSHPGKANVGKGKAKATDSTEEVDGDVEGNVKCTILHKGHEITVSINAVPAHILNHGDELVNEEDQGCLDLVGQPTGDGSGAPASEETAPGDTTQASPEQTTNDQQENEPEQTTNAQQENVPEEATETAGGSTETVETCDGKSIKLNKAEKSTLALHNKTRKENGLEPLCVDPTLQKAARAHSKEMIKEGYFGHKSRKGETSGERLKRLGYDWRATGENLARGSGPLSKLKNRFEAWMKSERHKKNILDRNFEQVGVGVVSGDLKKDGRNKQTVYTVDFGSK